MRTVQLISLGSLVMFTSCRLARTTASVEKDDAPVALVGIAPQQAIENSNETTALGKTPSNANYGLQENVVTAISPSTKINETGYTDFVDKNEKMDVPTTNQSENIQSFAQVKAMAARGSLKLNSKQSKRLDKLDHKYHGDLNQFKSDAGEFTQTAKIIAAVGIIGLLLVLLTGSFFGAFLAILAAGAFLCRWIGIIEF